jgi:hypothetical protein
MALPTKPEMFSYAEFGLQALCRQVSALRQGISCVCDSDQLSALGSFN